MVALPQMRRLICGCNNHHDIWLLRAQAKANSTSSSNADNNANDYSQKTNAEKYAKVKDKEGNIRGTTNGEMKSWAYVGMSGNFRDAQREMTKIRLEAKKHGVNIVQSKWETATVNY